MANPKEVVKKTVVGTLNAVKGGEPIETSVHPHANQQMGGGTVWSVVVYLMLVFLAAAWLLWTLWVAEAVPPQPQGAEPAAGPLTFCWTPILAMTSAISLDVESRLILVVFLIGGLGGTIASFNSLANYRGEGALTKSWSLHYVVSPWLGAGVAMLTYLVLRAGFFPGWSDQGEGGAIPWGVVAIAGLAGLFYDKSLLKLQQVFVTVFNPQDNRGGKLGQLAITTTSLQTANVGKPYAAQLRAQGGEGGLSWSVSPALPDGLNLDVAEGTIQGTPSAATEERPYTFSVTDESGSAAESKLAFEITT